MLNTKINLKNKINKDGINMKISDLLIKDRINLDVKSTNKVDIIKELKKPGLDIRDEKNISPVLRSDVLKLEDLSEGMILKGTVRNVLEFGAFVDIGVKNDGLVHISQLSDKFIKNPMEVVSIGDIVNEIFYQ